MAQLGAFQVQSRVWYVLNVMETTPGYEWQRPYEAAIFETVRTKLPKLIEAAQAAIEARRAEMNGTGSPAELRAIEEARSGLRILIAETRAL